MIQPCRVSHLALRVRDNQVMVNKHPMPTLGMNVGWIACWILGTARIY